MKLATDDGTFDEAADVKLRYDATGGLSTFGINRELGDVGGSFAVLSNDNGQLGFSFDGAGESCAGEIRLTLIMAGEGNIGSAVSGPIASWSKSGCPLGEGPIDLDQPLANSDQTASERLEDLFGDVRFPGEWDDGEKTELHLQVALEVDTACQGLGADKAIAVPVGVTYGTTDGRLGEHPAKASVRLYDENVPDSLALWIDDTLRCKGAGDELPYTLNDCDSLGSIQVQLGINVRSEDIGFTDSGLSVYEYDRAHPQGIKAAQTVFARSSSAITSERPRDATGDQHDDDGARLDTIAEDPLVLVGE